MTFWTQNCPIDCLCRQSIGGKRLLPFGQNGCSLQLFCKIYLFINCFTKYQRFFHYCCKPSDWYRSNRLEGAGNRLAVTAKRLVPGKGRSLLFLKTKRFINKICENCISSRDSWIRNCYILLCGCVHLTRAVRQRPLCPMAPTVSYLNIVI